MIDAKEATEETLQLGRLAKKHGIPVSVSLAILVGVVYATVWASDVSNRVENLEENNRKLNATVEEIKKGDTLYQIYQKQAIDGILRKLDVALPPPIMNPPIVPHPHAQPQPRRQLQPQPPVRPNR